MADGSLSASYAEQRRRTEREDLLRWRDEVLAQPPVAPPAPAAAAGPEKLAEHPDVTLVKKAASTAWDTFQQGAQNIADAIYSRAPQSLGTSVGQGVLGALQIASALPAGAGAAVRESIKQYSPGLDGKTALPGGQNSAAGFLRTMLGAPGLLLDPKIKAADPRAVEQAINEPMTYGEMIDILTQFAAPVAAGKVVGGLRGRGPTAPQAPQPQQPAAPVRPLRGQPVETAPAALPPGPEIAGALEPRVLVTPPPAEAGAGAAAGARPMTPSEVAIELRTVLERLPHPEPARAGVRAYQEGPPLIQGGPSPGRVGTLLDAQGRPLAPAVVQAMAERERLRALERTRFEEPGRPAAAPETAPTPEGPGGDLGTALDRALARTAKAIDEEMPTATAGPPEAMAGAPTPALGEAGRVDPYLLARLAIGAAAGGAAGDTPEERIVGALAGLGVGAAVSRRLATRIVDIYKESRLADESGMIDFSKFSRRPSVQAAEQPYQPNYQRLVITPELKRFSVNLHRMMKQEILERRGPAKSHDVTIQAARELIDAGKMTAERILTLEDMAMLSREEITAARMISQRSRDYAQKLNEAYKTGQIQGQELVDAVAVAGAISKNVRVAQTRIAQAQEASRIKVGYERPGYYRPDDVIHLADDLSRNATPEQISKGLDSIETPRAKQVAIETAALFPRAFLELMYFGQLSGEAMPRNAIGGLIMPPIAMAEVGIAPYMYRWGLKDTRVLPGSAAQMFSAYSESMVDMFRLLKFWDPEARAKLRGLEAEVGGPHQLEERGLAISAENFGGGAAMDWLGAIFNIPSQVLGTTDAMAKIVNARMWQRFESFHQASREGLAGDGLVARVNDLMADPALLSDTARTRIQDFTERQTFTKDFDPNTFFGWMQRGPQGEYMNALYRWQLMPYWRTPARALESGFERTPLLNFLMQKFRDDWRAGGQQRQIAEAKVVFGTAVLATFAYMESNGGITGDPPDDPKLARLWETELGWQPRSWWDPAAGKWRSYDGLAPMSDLIAAGANMSAAGRRTSGDVAAVVVAGALAMAGSFDTKAYTRALSEWLNIARPGMSDDAKYEQFIALQRQKLTGLFNPAFAREIETGIDPEIRRARPSGKYDQAGPGSAVARELDVMVRQWMSQVPGLSSLKDKEGLYLVPPDRDRIDGHPTVIETAPFVPLRSKTPVQDPLKFHLFGELQGAGLAPWPEWIGGARPTADIGIGTRAEENVSTGVRMTPQEKDHYAHLFAQEIRNGAGLTYRQALEAAVADPVYQAQPRIGPSGTPRDGEQARWIQRIDREFHKLTTTRMRGLSKALDTELARKEMERTARRVPEPQRESVRDVFRSLAR